MSQYAFAGARVWERMRPFLGLLPTLERIAIDLDQDGFMPLRQAGGVRLTCLSGIVWLTIDGDARDIVLEPGGTHTLPQDRGSFVMALTPARIALST